MILDIAQHTLELLLATQSMVFYQKVRNCPFSCTKKSSETIWGAILPFSSSVKFLIPYRGVGERMSKYFQFIATSKLLVTYRVWNNHEFRIKLLYPSRQLKKFSKARCPFARLFYKITFRIIKHPLTNLTSLYPFSVSLRTEIFINYCTITLIENSCLPRLFFSGPLNSTVISITYAR